MSNPRQIAFLALREIYRRGAYTNIAIDRVLRQTELSSLDRSLVTELVYGIVRRQRTLDNLIEQFSNKTSQQQPPDLRIVLHLGLYQLRYLTQIPESAAVNTSVELAKENGLKRLSGVVNGILRNYLRLTENNKDPLTLSDNSTQRLGVLYSFPDWLIEQWTEQFGVEETEKLCHWFNQSPTIDLRINPLKTTIETVENALEKANITVSRLPHLPQALRLTNGTGSIQQLPGYQEGWWTVQDSSAQLVTYLLNPQPGEIVIDACAAPGGKTTHIAELMQDSGKIFACDRAEKRLRKLQESIQRLRLHSIELCTVDSRQFDQFTQLADRVLLDAPCSGLGTIHRKPDLRWRQTPENLQELAKLQSELLEKVATWVKPQGILVYATCTLNPLENENIVQNFLKSHPHWQIQPPESSSPAAAFVTSSGWLKILPHCHQMDGFFLVKLKKNDKIEILAQNSPS